MAAAIPLKKMMRCELEEATLLNERIHKLEGIS